MSGPTDMLAWPARVGVRSGDTVQLMADLTRMAWNVRKAGGRFDAAAFLKAFIQAVGPSGTLLVPTFNFDLRNGDRFDLRRTRSTTGALAHAALAHPGARRTPHALHSFAVFGHGADELASSMEPSSFGPGSPFAYLHRQRGKLMCIDLPFEQALTFVHYVEEDLRVGYRKHRTLDIHYTDAAGDARIRAFSLFAKKAGHGLDFTVLMERLSATGASVSGEAAGSRWTTADLERTYAVVADDIRTNGARSIHVFRWSWWLRDALKAVLRTFGSRTRKERLADAARTL